MNFSFLAIAVLFGPLTPTAPDDCPHPPTAAHRLFAERGKSVVIEISREELLAFRAVREAGHYRMLDDSVRHLAEKLVGRPIGRVRWLEIIRQYEPLSESHAGE